MFSVHVDMSEIKAMLARGQAELAPAADEAVQNLAESGKLTTLRTHPYKNQTGRLSESLRVERSGELEYDVIAGRDQGPVYYAGYVEDMPKYTYLEPGVTAGVDSYLKSAGDQLAHRIEDKMQHD